MQRREFWHVHTLASIVGAAEETAAPGEISLLRVCRPAMATTFEIALPYDSSARVAAVRALDLVDRLESQLTVYRESSEVCRLNRTAFAAPVPAERGLYELLRLAARLHQETEGAFDAAAGALVRAWGFFQGPPRIPSDEELHAARQMSGMQHVVLNDADHTVRFLRRGVEINLGSIGKGYALDRAAEQLSASGRKSVLLQAGQSSVRAMGFPMGTAGWPVGILHPWTPDRRLAVVYLRDQALGTSAATFRHVKAGGRKLGHVLDPRTGRPAEGMASASVIAPTAAEADALSTAFFILGIDRAQAYCATHPGIAAVLLSSRPDAEPVFIGLEPCAA